MISCTFWRSRKNIPNSPKLSCGFNNFNKWQWINYQWKYSHVKCKVFFCPFFALINLTCRACQDRQIHVTFSDICKILIVFSSLSQNSLDEVEKLIKRHEAFEKALYCQEERFTALEKLTTVSLTYSCLYVSIIHLVVANPHPFSNMFSCSQFMCYAFSYCQLIVITSTL